MTDKELLELAAKPKKTGCQCEFCLWHDEFKRHIEPLPAEAKAFFHVMADVLLEAQQDAEYYKAIVQGTYPNADKLIADWRSRAAAEIGKQKG
jgi:hypothetical protein